MIIVQTPLRISFLGGGTDFEDFYIKHGGAVLSTTVDKCVFVITKERFDDMICVNYSKRERVETVDDIRHDLVREAMRITDTNKSIEITTLADIPSKGSGMGSSSSITIALLHALYAHHGVIRPAETLASEACQIEIDTLGSPIGKQDQYIAAYGGLRFITFGNGGIEIEKIHLPNGERKQLDDNLHLFYTGITRQSNGILSEQKANIDDRIETLIELKKLAFEAKDAISCGEFDSFGEIMRRGWELKKNMASRITNSQIDEIYETAIKAGALGGKVSGAGGGGFLLLYCPKHKQDSVRNALRKLQELPFHFEPDGSKVIFNYRRV